MRINKLHTQILALVFAIFGTVSTSSIGQPAKTVAAANPQKPTITVLHCGNVFDGSRLALLGEHSIRIEGNRIAAIQRGLVVLPGAGVIDLKAHTCLPGLIDLHVHLSMDSTNNLSTEMLTLSPTDFALRAVPNAQKTLLAGFTSVRDLLSPQTVMLSVRNAVNQGRINGPRIQVAGGVATPGGHIDIFAPGLRADLSGNPGPEKNIITGPDEAARVVRQFYRDGVDLIKIASTGGVLSLGRSGDAPQLTDAELTAIVATARDYRLPVACHAHGKEGMLRAIRAGVTSIEHGSYLDEEVIAAMKEKGTWLVPTISAGRYVAETAKPVGSFPDVVRMKALAIGNLIQAAFGRAYKGGVKVAFGSDTGVSPHGENAQEFEYMVEAGMPPLEALRAATLSAATVMGMQQQLGTLEVNKLADIVAVPGDPAADIRLMRKVSFVMKDGVVFKKP